MNRKEIDQIYRRICEMVSNGRLKSALDELTKPVRATARDDYFYRFETISENYRTLLRYAYDGYHDPKQEAILHNLAASILVLADEARLTLLEREMMHRKLEKHAMMHHFGEDAENIAAKISEMFFHREVEKLISEADLDGDGIIPDDIPLPVRDIDLIFKQYWLTQTMAPPLADLTLKIGQSEDVAWYEKCLVVSALTLSALGHFDPQKLILLIDFVELKQEQVRQRALTGLVLLLIVYDTRIRHFHELMTRLRLLTSDDTVREETELVLMQFLMARETEKITREFEEEVLPEMKKMMPRIEDKLNLGDNAEDEDPDEKNPGWKDMIEEVPGLFEKIEKFSKMQMEGGDVFMSTFQMLKRFDFFNAMSNWFVPFHSHHPEVAELVPESEEVSARLLESLEKAFYICNSDKYSFTLNFRAIPEQQRTMIVANFEAELAQMSEMATEEQLLDHSLVSNAVFIQYIQDIYRFFKLYPHRQEFDDVFQRRIRFNELYFYREFFSRNTFLEKLAAFFFDNDHYYDAAEIYESLIERNEPRGDYFEKTGYCYQKTGRFRKAVEFYRKAELFDTDRVWLLKKLGWCSLKLKDYPDALQYFEEAAKLQPDDFSLQLQVGQCYLNLKDYAKALHHYSGLRFFAPDNLRVLRPVAYCHFVLGNPEAAMEHFATILANTSSPTAYDLMNAAHVKLCLGLRAEAIALYRQAFGLNEPGREALMEAFDEDTPYLLANGIAPQDIPLIRDHLLFLTES